METTSLFEAKPNDIRDSAECFQLPITKDDFVDAPVILKAVNALSVTGKEEELISRTGTVKLYSKKITVYFLKIGQILKSLQCDFDWTKFPGGFKEYCRIYFDYGRSTVFNLIRIYDLFAAKVYRDEKYSKYTYSQLVELVAIAGRPEEAQITPKYSVSQIRDFKRDLKEKEKGVKEVVRKDDKVEDSMVEFDFENEDQARSFLLDYDQWQIVGEVQLLEIIYFRCYLSDGRQLIAERTGHDDRGLKACVYFHWLTEDGNFIHSSLRIDGAIKMLLNNELRAKLLPYDVGEIKKAS